MFTLPTLAVNVGSVNIILELIVSTNYHHGNLRLAVLEKAIETIASSGIEKLSLRAIARDLNVSHTAPVRHFATKADLLRAIAEEGVDELIESTATDHSQSEALDKLLQMSLAYVDWTRAHPVYHQVLRNPEVMRFASVELKNKLLSFSNQQMSAIKQAQSDGWYTNLDPQTLLLHLVSITAGTAITLTDPIYAELFNSETNDDVVKQSLRLFLS